jgi:hypothetical protein
MKFAKPHSAKKKSSRLSRSLISTKTNSSLKMTLSSFWSTSENLIPKTKSKK